MKVIFMGTPEFAIPTLEALIASDHEVVAVYTQPPRPAGRGKKDHPSPVQELAEKHSIPVFTPTTLKDKETQDAFAAHGADVAVVAAYGLILPKPVLDATPHGCINIHPSRLPRWRGAAPIQRTIMFGDQDTSICIMQMDEGLDTGDVLLEKEDIMISENMTTGELHDLLAADSAPLLLEALESVEAGTLTPRKQDDHWAVYAPKVEKTERKIDWSWPAELVHHHIRGLSPYPTATFTIEDETIKVLRSEMAHTISFAKPGTLMNDQLSVACGDGGVVRLRELQRPGKQVMQANEFLRGFPLKKGTRLG